jgi:putative membrane protein
MHEEGPLMMWDYGYGAWWMWVPGLLLTLLIVGGVIVLIVWLVRSTGSSAGSVTGATAPSQLHEDSARRILEERLARGEITSDEFRELVTTLNDTRRK